MPPWTAFTLSEFSNSFYRGAQLELAIYEKYLASMWLYGLFTGVRILRAGLIYILV